MNIDLKVINASCKSLDVDYKKHPDTAMAVHYLGEVMYRKILEDFPTMKTIIITITGESNGERNQDAKRTKRSLNPPAKVLTGRPIPK